MYSLAPPTPGHLTRLQALAPDCEILPVADEAYALDATRDAEVILGHRFLRQCLPTARCLRWVQTSAQGVDRLPLDDLARRDIQLTRSTLDADTVAAHAIAMAWALARALPAALAQQASADWRQRLPFAPLPARALVLGMGAIGQALARRLAAQDIRVHCAKRTATAADAATSCAEVLTADRWRTALPETDWCFLALPLNADTRGIFDEAAMRALPAQAVLVNVGRGETLDTSALQRVLAENHLAGAALDVVDNEPLPPGDPLWRAPRVLLTPHVASHHPDRIERIERFFEAQVRRYVAGEPLAETVDLAARASKPKDG